MNVITCLVIQGHCHPLFAIQQHRQYEIRAYLWSAKTLFRVPGVEEAVAALQLTITSRPFVDRSVKVQTLLSERFVLVLGDQPAFEGPDARSKLIGSQSVSTPKPLPPPKA